MKTSLFVHLGLGAALAVGAAACGGGGATGGGRVVTGPGGQPITPAGSEHAVTPSANQRFSEAAQMMRQHDEASEGRGDWNPGTCNDVAARFEQAANEQPNGSFAEAWFNRGLAFERCNLTDQARQAFERANSAAGTAGYCRARVQLGVYQFRNHQTAEALATFTQSIERDQNCVEGYTNRAMILRERGQGDDRRNAVADIRQALARDDRYIPALNQLALTYLAEAGDDPRSQRLMLAGIVCSQAVQVTAQHQAEMAADVRSFVADVYNTWGLIDIRSGQIIRALDHFRRAYTLNANMYEAWMNYGTINLSFRGYADARDAFQHAVQLRDGEYDAHIGLGVALRGLGQAAPAQAEYERARAIDANRPDAFYNLGVLYENYMGNEIADLRRARGYLSEFVTKAGGTPRYAASVTRANQHIHNIDQAITALEAGAALNAQNPGSAAPPAGSAATPAAGGSTPPPAATPSPAPAPAPAH